MAEREALRALVSAVTDLRVEVSALGAGMAQMLAAQQAQTALLDALLATVTDLGTEGGGDGLAEALGGIADSLDAQSDTLDGMRIGLDAIPGAVAAAVQAGR